MNRELCGILVVHEPHEWQLLVDNHQSVPPSNRYRFCSGGAWSYAVQGPAGRVIAATKVIAEALRVAGADAEVSAEVAEALDRAGLLALRPS